MNYAPPQYQPVEPAHQKPRKTHKIRNAVLIAVAVIVAAVIGAAIGHGSSSPSHPAASGHSSPAAAATTSAAPPAPAVPSPKGTSTESCNYNLSNGDNPSDAGTLTGEIDMTNTGNVGIIVKATEAWPQQGGAPITRTKTVKVPYGASGQPVMFSVTANDTMITNLQNWEQGHNYPSDDCSGLYKVSITGTYGSAHS